ncbi:MAG: GspH/FimT family pseudopilin [Desulfuromonadaceae bacterium]|nr:GspH/FimT family pseudopilin [Desulfuromonadaceae bacterium]
MNVERIQSGQSRQAGFTLIEVIVVTAILGILMTIVVTTIGNRGPRTRLKSDARDLVSHMQLARVNAIRDTLSWAIEFDPDNRRYQIFSQEKGTRGAKIEWLPAEKTLYRTVALSNAVQFGTQQGVPDGSWVTPPNGVSFTANRVVFNPNGTSKSGTVYLSVPSGETFAISSLSTTGRVKTWFNYGDDWKE